MPTMGTVTMPGTVTNAEPDWRKAIERAKLLLADEPMHFALLRMYTSPAGPVEPAPVYQGTQYVNPNAPGEWRYCKEWGGVVLWVRDDYWANFIEPGSVYHHTVLCDSMVTRQRAKLTPMVILKQMGVFVDTHTEGTKVG